ncbi:hypothetical protein F4861DRAFT_31452 [Xylaria intraflava]|nr:hypothetical protein F4861DRAFT_31452 [Xylaria intraflava]
MSHPQPSLAQRQFSPPQASSPSPSNATTPAAFSLPPSKRPKVSPAPPHSHSQPTSPYVNPTPYAASPTSSSATPAAATGLPSPPLPANMAASTTQLPQGSFNSSQSNGRFAPMAPAQPSQIQSPIPTPQIPIQSLRQISQASQPRNTPATSTATTAHSLPQYPHVQPAPVNTSPAMPATGNMGPPAIYTSASFSAMSDTSRQQPPRSAPSKTASYDVNDMLMGTGIDLEEEADIQNSLETRTGFSHLPGGGRDSFYGAGSTNQLPQSINAKTPEEYAALSADRAWNEAAHRLAVTRSQESRHHLLEPGVVHKRIHDIAQKFGLDINVDIKAEAKSQYAGKSFQPSEFPQPELKTAVQPGPAGTVVQTYGSFIPKESFLIDQITLLSLGTKERLQDLLSDANKIAATRQNNSHGVIPTEWVEAAAPLSPQVNGIKTEDTQMGGMGALSPHTNPPKRSLDNISNGKLLTPVSEVPPPNNLIDSLLELGKQSQDMEEGRLRKRQKRLEKLAEKSKEGTDAGARTGPATPGMSGSIAPDGGDTKSLSKKEGKKAAARAAESSSGTTVNATLSLFTGGKKKKYSWMTSGASSGASTPRLQGAPGTPSGNGGIATKAGRGPLTKASVAHLGQFREDSEKGKNIQLRDWIVTLEDRGLDPRSLQIAYGLVDKSDTGTKAATEKS